MAIAIYQGVPGAYSQLVLDHYLHASDLVGSTVGASSYRDVAVAVAGGRVDIGVLPIENAIGGTVRESYDLVAEFGLRPRAEVLWRTDHRLLGIPGASLAGVREILGHPLVIAECGTFLSGMPAARAIPCEDTGVAAREVARAGNAEIAALAPAAAARIYTLIELAEHCADNPHTYTRFLVVAPPVGVDRNLATVRAPVRKTSLIFSLTDAPGKLTCALTHLARRDLNLTKLESKPRLGHGNDHVFYADITGDAADPAVADALREIAHDSRTLIILGSYDAHVGPPIGADPAPSRIALERLPETWQPLLAETAANALLPRVSRPARPDGSSLQIGKVRIGDGGFTIIAGPCAVESRDQILQTAHAVQARGAVMLRGGAFKPRTSPYAFQGLGWEGVGLLAEAGRATGMPVVSEVMTTDQVERMASQIDVLQIGARNMQNFDLLKAVGRTGHTVLLKRGLSATIDELLAAAEYIMAEGNPNVILCERGIRTFETATRNTLDLSAIPVLRERSHLPVLVDPSHAVGVRRWVRPLCRAAKAVGAHGLLIEVHPNPPEAKSDKEQALTFDDFAQIVADLDTIPLATQPVVPA